MPQQQGVVTVGVLRELFRGLQVFESFHESCGIDSITDPSGFEWTIWDVRYLYRSRSRLSARQAQAIEMCLYQGVSEEDAAIRMGIKPQSPVCIYATNGLKKIVAMIEAGELPQFRLDEMAAA